MSEGSGRQEIISSTHAPVGPFNKIYGGAATGTPIGCRVTDYGAAQSLRGVGGGSDASALPLRIIRRRYLRPVGASLGPDAFSVWAVIVTVSFPSAGRFGPRLFVRAPIVRAEDIPQTATVNRTNSFAQLDAQPASRRRPARPHALIRNVHLAGGPYRRQLHGVHRYGHHVPLRFAQKRGTVTA